MAGFKSELARGEVVQHHGRVEQDLDLRLHAQVATQTIAHFRTGKPASLSFVSSDPHSKAVTIILFEIGRLFDLF